MAAATRRAQCAMRLIRMNNEQTTPRAAWRDFLNRREPGARWMLLFLVLLATGETVLLFSHPGGWGHGNAKSNLIPLLIPLVVTLVALLTSRWWSLPSSPAYADQGFETPPSSRRWIWLMAGAVAILAMWPRSARLNHSFNGKEIEALNTAYRYSREHPSAEGDNRSEPTGARRLVLNHFVPQFAVEFLGQDLREDSPINERAARTLPWAAGIIITVALVVLLASAMGSPRAGLAAGLILAMHPQHVRWSTEVAGASFQLLWFAAALLCVLNAMLTNRWRWWVALGIAQAFSLLGGPEGLPGLLAMNGAAAIVLWRSKAAGRDRVSHLLRLVVALAIAAVTLPIPSSCVLTGFYPQTSFIDLWAMLFSGVPWNGDAGNMTGSAVLREMVNEAAWRGWLLSVLLPLLVVAGLFFMFRQDWRTRFVAAMSALLLLAPAPDGPAQLLLPLILTWAGAGLIRQFPGQPRLIHVPLLIAAVYVLTTSPILQRLMGVPIEPIRDAASAGRAMANRKPATATFGHHAQSASAYDPGVRIINSIQNLNALVDVAYEKDLPLLVYHSRSVEMESEWQPLIEALTTSGRFLLIKELPAFDPARSYRLYQYQPREQIIRLNVKPEKK